MLSRTCSYKSGVTSSLLQADLYAGALFIGQALQWNIYTSIIVLLIIASIFTITGASHDVTDTCTHHFKFQ